MSYLYRATPYHPRTNFSGEILTRHYSTEGSAEESCNRRRLRFGSSCCLPMERYHKHQQGSLHSNYSIYGRDVQVPLDILKEEGEADKRSNESVASHMMS